MQTLTGCWRVGNDGDNCWNISRNRQEDEVTKITHTARPMTISSGFIPDETTRLNDEHFKRMQERKLEKRGQTLDLMMLLSALESWMFSVGKAPPDYLIERIDSTIELLKKEVLGDAEG